MDQDPLHSNAVGKLPQTTLWLCLVPWASPVTAYQHPMLLFAAVGLGHRVLAAGKPCNRGVHQHTAAVAGKQEAHQQQQAHSASLCAQAVIQQQRLGSWHEMCAPKQHAASSIVPPTVAPTPGDVASNVGSRHSW